MSFKQSVSTSTNPIFGSRVGLTLGLAISFAMFGLANASSKLIFPRLSFERDTITGIAIVNPNDEDAELTVTAYGGDGEILKGTGFENPLRFTIPARRQYTSTTASLFKTQLAPEKIGWFEAVSSSSDLTGFFLFLDTQLTFFDGADLPRGDEELVFDEVRLYPPYSTEINLINPNATPVTVQLELNGPPERAREQLVVSAHGVVRLDAATFFDLEKGIPRELSITATADLPIHGFEFVRGQGDLLGLNARPASEKLNTLFFPQLAVLGPFRSEIVVENQTAERVLLTLTAYRPDGKPYGPDTLKINPVVTDLDKEEILRADVAEMFQFSGDETRDGWIKVESTSEAINGCLSYALPGIESMAAVASVAQGSKQIIFSHIATTLGFFTGLAILNSGSLAANVRVVALQPDGDLLGTYTATLRPGERLSKLINELIPAADDQAGGLIWVSSDLPVYATSLFGSLASGVLANIPPQPVPKSYQPDQAIARIKVTPPLAVLQPKSSVQFHLENPAGSPQWMVNGRRYGTPLTGTITSQGRYTAPSPAPEPLPVTITAAAGDQTAGASVDVLERKILVAGLGSVQSVAYLAGLQRLYTAELTTAGSLSRSQKTLSNGTSTTIFDVTGNTPRAIREFDGEEISKMTGFTAADGGDYLLLAARTSGKIVRLDPDGLHSRDVATGLNGPIAMVVDPVSGDLLVAEQDRVTTLPSSQLNEGLISTALSTRIGSAVQRVELKTPAVGIAVDRCSGDVFLSNAIEGSIVSWSRRTRTLKSVVSGLDQPGRLLAVYRHGISCPASFHLLVVEQGRGRIVLVKPEEGSFIPWADAEGIRDLVFLPEQSELVGPQGVVVGQSSGATGRLEFVGTPGIYHDQAINPPPDLVPPAFAGPCPITQITDSGPGGYSSIPRISGDGNWIVFESSSDHSGENGDGSEEIFLYDRFTDSFRQLTSSSLDSGVPSISRDGSWVSFSTSGVYGGPANDQAPGVYLLNVQKGTPQLLATPVDPGVTPPLDAFSVRTDMNSAGDRIVFRGDDSDIYLYDRVRGQLSRATNLSRTSWFPTISGDGRWVTIYTSDNLNGNNPSRAEAVYLLDLQGSSYEFVAIDNSRHWIFWGSQALSYDGNRLLIVSEQNLTGENPDGRREIFLYDRAAKKFMQLTKDTSLLPLSEAWPTLGGFSEDSRWIAYTGFGDPLGTNPDGAREVFLYDTASARLFQITQTDQGHMYWISLSGDGKLITFSATDDIVGTNPSGNLEVFLADCSSLK